MPEEAVKTEQMKLGPGFVLKAIKELGLPTVLVCVMSAGIYMLWNVSRQDLQKAMASASEERQAIYAKHAQERDAFVKDVTEKLDKIRRDVRRDKNCKTDED